MPTSPDEKPPTEKEFTDWMREHLDVDLGEPFRRFYEVNANSALVAIQKHPFFSNLDKYLDAQDVEYGHANDYRLLMSPADVSLQVKPFRSILNKLFRQNIVWNLNFPNPPDEGWVVPENCFLRLNDIVRSTIVCKYIDGPRELADLLSQHARDHSVNFHYKSQERDAGYYAYHFYTLVPIELADFQFNTVSAEISVELQLTTQLQEIMYKITHQHYADIRAQPEDDPGAWKWDVSSDRFRAGYLAHTLHLLEAIILDLRDSKIRGGGDPTEAPSDH